MKAFCTILCITAVVFLHGLAAGQTADKPRKGPPTIFTPEVIEATKQATEKTAEVEQSIHKIVEEADKTAELYRQSKCDEATDSDEGCRELKKQIQEKYLALLHVVGSVIPQLDKSLTRANGAMGKQIRKELGMKSTPLETMKSLSQAKQGPRDTLKRPNSLTARIIKYREVMARQGGRNPSVLASEIYIDQADALYNLRLLQQETGYQAQQLEVELKLGVFDKETIAKAQGIRNILFGDDTETPGAFPAAPLVESGGASGSGPLGDL